MAPLDYNEIKERKMIIYKDEPFEILESHVARTNQRKPQNQVKMRNMINGKVIPATFHATESVEEADVSRKQAKFLYASKGEFWFCDPKDPKNRYTIDDVIIGDYAKFLKTDTICEILVFEYEDEEKIIGIKLPVKMTFLVKEAPPSMKGNTVSGGGKLVTIETGAQITTPLFIETGELIVVNTETGLYTERANRTF